MPKRKTGKKRAIRQLATRKPLSVPVPAQKIADEDLAVGEKITRYHSTAILLACIPTFYILTNLQWLQERAGNFLGWILTTHSFLVPISLYLNHGFPTPTTPRGDAKGYKRRAVILLAMAIFINLTSWLPIIHAFGYFDAIINYFPGKEKLSGNMALFLAFIGGALVSGIVGNAAYDILKYGARKAINRK